MELWERIGSRNKKGRVKLSANGRTTPNIGEPTMLGVLASVLAVVYKRMKELPTMLGPAVHRGKDTTHKTLETMCNARAWHRGCNISELKQRRRRRQRERQKKKSNWFRLTKQRLCTCITLFCTFLSRRCTTTTWKCLISRFVEDGGNTRQRVSFSFPELWYSLLEFSSRKSCQHLRNWTRWNKRETVWSRATLLFKWRFRSRCRRCCLSSLLLCYASAITEQKNCLELLAQTFDRF